MIILSNPIGTVCTKGSEKMIISGKKIKEYREKKKMTRAELAKAAGISYNTLVSWESERRIPQDISLITKVSDSLDINWEYLVDDDLEKDFYDTEVSGAIDDKLIELVQEIYNKSGEMGLLRLIDRFIYITGPTRSIKIMERFINESSEN